MITFFICFFIGGAVSAAGHLLYFAIKNESYGVKISLVIEFIYVLGFITCQLLK